MKQVLFLGVLLWFVVAGNAQQRDSLLQEVTVLEKRFSWLQAAQFSTQPDAIGLALAPMQSVANWLPELSSVHVRQYAPGMVASYSAHGATSAQNTVLWGGVPINSAATGLTDLSLLPASLFQPTFLQGGSSAHFGSGAMGSILALQNPVIPQGVRLQLMQQAGSFNTFQSALKFTYATPKLALSTRILGSRSANTYTFHNPYKPAQPIDTVRGAAYSMMHIVQTLAYFINPHNRIDAGLWYNIADRESPQNILVSTPSKAHLKDINWRLRTGWHLAKGKHKADVVVAFLHEWERYTNPLVARVDGSSTDDTNRTVSHIMRADYAFSFSKHVTWQNGVHYRADQVSGNNRQGHQNTATAQTGIQFKSQRLEAQAALRAEIWNAKRLPVSPFVSMAWHTLSGITLSAFGGYNYRVPGMNDRFWIPGGNPDLRPESGWSFETAATYNKNMGPLSLHGRASFYRSVIDDLIQWLPGSGSIWTPQNVKQVRLQGADIGLSIDLRRNQHHVGWRGGASYTQARVMQSHTKNDQSVGKQLIYQPELKLTQQLHFAFNGWMAKVHHRFVGQVYTLYASANNTLPAYHLLDVGMGYSFNKKWLGAAWSTALNVNNVTNIYYENIAYFPMPGINMNLTVTVTL